MKLQKLDLNKLSQIDCTFSISNDQTLLVAKITGSYQEGSEGNIDGFYIFSQIVSYYFIYESICLVLDLRDLKYTWGNTLLKSLDFFNEIGRDNEERNKPVLVVCSDANEQSIASLLNPKKFENLFISKDLDKALKIASERITQYLK